MSKYSTINDYNYNSINKFDCVEDLIIDLIYFYKPNNYKKFYNKIFKHGIRVMENCKLIILEETKIQGCKIIDRASMRNILLIASPLHDIGKLIQDGKGHEHIGAEMVKNILM